MRVVVSHVRLQDPSTEALRRAAEEGGRRLVEAGGTSFQLVEVDENHLILVLFFPDLETEERISREVGGPWMREHVLPLLASPPGRSAGDAVVAVGEGL